MLELEGRGQGKTMTEPMAVKINVINQLKLLDKQLKNCSRAIYTIYYLSSSISYDEQIVESITNIDPLQFFKSIREKRCLITSLIRRLKNTNSIIEQIFINHFQRYLDKVPPELNLNIPLYIPDNSPTRTIPVFINDDE